MTCNPRSRSLISMLAVCLVFLTGSTLAGQTVPLFDGRTFSGWTTLEGQPIGEGWEIVDGVIHRKAGAGRAGQLITEQEYGDFDLRFEWRIAPKGNSGLKYRVRSFDGKILGCEYQILDDSSFTEQLPPTGMTGSLYDVYEPNECRFLRPCRRI